MAIKEKIKSAPDAPGVYLIKDCRGRVIYVGKAKSLKARLLTYLSGALNAKNSAMMNNACGIEFIEQANESLALLLEASLIHRYNPKYNVSLRDDKSYPMVRLSLEDYPRIYISRNRDAGAPRLLGPFTDARLLRQALKIIRRQFPFRSCKKLPEQACIYHRINLCPAPCIGRVNKDDYARLIDSVTLILEGRTDVLVKKLSRKMQAFAKDNNFEQAAEVRDQINALSSLGAARLGIDPMGELQEAKEALGLDKIPLRIEAFDISNISGKEAAGSMVSFLKARPDKNNYRRFRIRLTSGINDYGMLREVLLRRYQRLKNEGLPLPDLILIDGGKGHLSTAQRELAALGLKVPLASIAKKKEHIYTLRDALPLKLKEGSAALNLIRRVRDEAHRFALAYHHILRRRQAIARREEGI